MYLPSEQDVCVCPVLKEPLKSWPDFKLQAITQQEQNQQRDLRCIYAAAKSQGLNVKLRGSTIIFDDIKYTYKDIDALPHGLTMEKVKIVKVLDGYASSHIMLSCRTCTLVRLKMTE